MTIHFDIEQWQEIADRGTSGDQVHDILADWKANNIFLHSRITELETAMYEIKSAALNDAGRRSIMAIVDRVMKIGKQ